MCFWDWWFWLLLVSFRHKFLYLFGVVSFFAYFYIFLFTELYETWFQNYRGGQTPLQHEDEHLSAWCAVGHSLVRFDILRVACSAHLSGSISLGSISVASCTSNGCFSFDFDIMLDRNDASWRLLRRTSAKYRRNRRQSRPSCGRFFVFS